MFKSTTARRLLASLAAVVLFSACSPVARPDNTPTDIQTPTKDATAPAAITRVTPSVSPSPSASPTPLPAVIGPDYMPGFNPLTGLPVTDPAALNQAPFLVSVTNFPLSARPQSGLSLASIVWEVSIGQGMSRFLAVFYGDYISQLEQILKQNPTDNPYGYVIAPIRSGRVVYEDIKVLFPDATLITRGASPEVVPQLTNRVGVLAVNSQDVNSAGLTLEDLRTLPALTVDPVENAGLIFARKTPGEGVPADKLGIIYNRFDQVGWDYSPEQGAYLRSQDLMDDTGILVPAVDHLTGQQLAFENVLILFANHHFENQAGTILEIDLLNRTSEWGLMFRDGMQYPVYWSTRRGNLSLKTKEGEMLALKPGQTFIEVVSLQSTWNDEEKLLRFHSPRIPTLVPSPTFTPTVTVTPTTTPLPTFEPTWTPSP
jgi:hypothetical protein